MMVEIRCFCGECLVLQGENEIERLQTNSNRPSRLDFTNHGCIILSKKVAEFHFIYFFPRGAFPNRSSVNVR